MQYWSFSLLVFSILPFFDAVDPSKDKHFDHEKTSGEPKFTDCFRYAPKIMVNSTINTEVIRVHAKDFTETDNDCIKYELTSLVNSEEGTKFKIDETTGIIRTNSIFNRESANGKMELIKIHAINTCNGNSSGFCIFNVTIGDVDDMQIRFNETFYMMLISKNTLVGREIGRVSATNYDEKNNTKLIYSIISQHTSENKVEFFGINERTGEIFLKKRVEVELVGSYFYIDVGVKNQNEEKPNTIVHVVIILTGEIVPFLDEIFPNEVLRIPEDVTDFKYPMMHLKAKSNLSNDSRVWFSLLGHCRRKNLITIERLYPLDITPIGEAADIWFGEFPDVKEFEYCTLFIVMQNSLGGFALKKVPIEIVSNEFPVLPYIQPVEIPENESPGFEIIKVQIINPDEHSQVTYAIKNNNNLFSINNETGIITTLVKFDREIKDFYQLPIVATKNFNGKLNSAEQLVSIHITDKNDNPVIFNQTIYEINSIPGNLNVSSPIITVNASDKDSDSRIRYSILSGNSQGFFDINNETGEIAIRSLDYKSFPKYNITVHADDGNFYADATVLISIDNKTSVDKKQDDLPSVLSPTNSIDYMGKVPQQLAKNENVLKISIENDTEKNSSITFSIIPISPKVSEYFKINETSGMISLNKTMDIDLGYSFRFIVIAKLLGTEQKISIIIKNEYYDVKYGCLFIHKIPHGHVKIPENFELGKEFLRFQALSSVTDNVNVSFQLISTNEKEIFLLDQSENAEAILVLNRALDYERKIFYEISATSRHTSVTLNIDIDIQVLDLNDNGPRFPEKLRFIKLKSSEKSGTILTQVHAIDKDISPEFHSIIYDLMNFNDFFEIDEFSGVIKTRVTFEKNIGKKYNLQIRARENMSQLFISKFHQDILTIKVTIV